MESGNQPGSAVNLNEPVRSILANKAHLLWSISPETTVFETVSMMSEKHIGAALVVSAKQLVGIVTERDYARKVILKGRQSRHTRVDEIMSSPVLYVTPSQTIEECVHLMSSRHIRHLPVLEGERTVGIVSIGDIINWLTHLQFEILRG